MFRKMSKSQARTYSLATLVLGALIYWFCASVGATSGALMFASSAWLVSAFYGLVWLVKSRRDARLVRVSHAPVTSIRPVAQPKASPDSSDLTLPDFD